MIGGLRREENSLILFKRNVSVVGPGGALYSFFKFHFLQPPEQDAGSYHFSEMAANRKESVCGNCQQRRGQVVSNEKK